MITSHPNGSGPRKKQLRRLRWLSWSGLLATLGLGAVTDWSVLGLLGPMRARYRQHAVRLQAGLTAEERVLGQAVPVPGSLSELPDTYELFRNLAIEVHGQRHVLDFLVVGTHAAYVVQARHLRGRIDSSPAAETWYQHRESDDRRAVRPFPNPMVPLEDTVRALRTWLRQLGLHLPSYGVVALTHPQGTLSVTHTTGVVRSLHVRDLATHLRQGESAYMLMDAWVLIHHLKTHTSRSRVVRLQQPKPIGVLARRAVAGLLGRHHAAADTHGHTTGEKK